MGVSYQGQLAGKEMELGKVTSSSASRSWLFRSDNRFTEEMTVLNYGIGIGILPIPYTTRLGTNPMLLCRKLKGKQGTGRECLKWIVTADYDSTPLGQSEQVNGIHPLQRPAKRRWSSAKYNKPIFQDINQKAIVNSAGDYFDPCPEVDRSRWVCTIQKNVPDVPTYIVDYTDAINAATFQIGGLTIGQGVAKLMSIEISEAQYEQFGDELVEFYVFTFAMEMRPEGWKLVLLDQGLRQISTVDSTKRVNILDDSTPPRDVTSPRLLNGSGKPLTNPSTTTAVYKTFDVYHSRDFTVLPIN